jgi:hypothetical protein
MPCSRFKEDAAEEGSAQETLLAAQWLGWQIHGQQHGQCHRENRKQHLQKMVKLSTWAVGFKHLIYVLFLLAPTQVTLQIKELRRRALN